MKLITVQLLLCFLTLLIVAKRLDGLGCHLVWRYRHGPGDIVLDGDPAPPRKGTQQPPLFGPCLLWPNGHPSQLLLSSYKQLSLHHVLKTKQTGLKQSRTRLTSSSPRSAGEHHSALLIRVKLRFCTSASPRQSSVLMRSACLPSQFLSLHRSHSRHFTLA